jgi:glycosyltransferase involved in cell wall biosynthesis
MKVLMITGDKRFGPGHPRYDLQAAQVEKLVSIYWGRGSMWPKMPQEYFDVVTVQDPFWRGLFAWRVARRIGAKFNVQAHTSILTILGKFILRRADSIRVVSEKIKKQVENIGVTAPIHILPIYIDVSKFKNLVRQPHNQKTILWVGRFETEKDPALAVGILKQICAQKIDVKLVMLGAGSLEQELRSLAEGLPVEFPGWQDPLLYLQTADVVLCTSKHESYGASIIEALAAGAPVVAPDVGVARAAGAIVVPREKLAEAVAGVLKSGQRGELKLQLPNAEQWAKQWKETL